MKQFDGAAHEKVEQASGASGGPLDRYMSVLELVAAFPDAITMMDVCSLLDLPKATAHRLLAGLTRAGLVEGGGRKRTYCLGDRLVRLIHTSADDGWIATLARGHLEVLVGERNETCYLTRLVGHRVFVVTRESPLVQWRHFVQPGTEMPPHASASAKAILAFQSEEVIARAFAEPPPRLTSLTRTAREDILQDYERIRAEGYATCVAEIDEGFGALAVPIVQSNGSVLHSVGITGPLQRIVNDEMPARIASLKATAVALSGALSLGSAIVARSRG